MLLLTVGGLIARVSVILFFNVCSVLGNGLVLLVYTKEKKQSGRVYVIALAIVDVTSCIFILPLFPMWEYALAVELMPFLSVFRSLLVAEALLYLFIQIAMATDQFIAVFFPFKRAQYRGKVNALIAVVACVLTSAIAGLALARDVSGIQVVLTVSAVGLGALFGCGIATLMIMYLATAFKLHRQQNKIKTTQSKKKEPAIKPRQNDGPAAASQGPEAPGQGAEATRHTERDTTTTAMHIKVLKVYSAITAVFVLSYAFMAVSAIRQIPWPIYLYQINHVSNPVVYYLFVDKFRNEAGEYWRKVRGCCCGARGQPISTTSTAT